jgi:hypothetical protein
MERDVQIFNQALAGKSSAAIAADHNVTQRRAQQIVLQQTKQTIDEREKQLEEDGNSATSCRCGNQASSSRPGSRISRGA